ncbi:MAG: hypothetical protein KKB62_03260 [Nanoarchaeota archaeon]|jgi:TRAP-type C4-dicarboxylate transport system permease small subunit|nr:hypothetical protein [Nanoarchaeota archaeon]
MKKETLTGIIIAVVVLFFLFGGMGFGSYSGMMGTMYGTYGYGMMFFGWIYGVLIITALVLLILWLLKQIKK